MGNPKVRRLQELDMRSIATDLNFVEDVLSVVIEARVKKTTHILKHNRPGLDFLEKTNGFGEEVPFVIFS